MFGIQLRTERMAMKSRALGALAVTSIAYSLAFSLPSLLLPSSVDARFATACILPLLVVIAFAFIRVVGLWRFCGLSGSAKDLAYVARSSLPYGILLLVPLANLWCAWASDHDLITLSATALVTLLCAALIEELVFRGFLIGILLDAKCSPLSTVVITAVLFACLHLFNAGSQDAAYTAAQFVVAGFIGLGLGFLRLSAASVWPCIVIHALTNATSNMSMRYDYDMLVTICIVAAIAGIASYLWWRSHFNAER